MCEPTTITATTMAYMAMASAAISAVTGLYSQSQASKAQAAYNKEQERQAIIQANMNKAAADRQAMQESEAAGQKINENNKQAMKAQSTAAATAGENNLSGLSIDALLRDLGGERDDYNQAVRQNLDRQMISIAQSKENADIQANSVIASLKPVQQPDYLGSALKIVDTAYTYGKDAGWYNNVKNTPRKS